MPRLLRVKRSTVAGRRYDKLRVNVVVAQETARALDWKPGDELEVVKRKGGLFLRKKAE